MNRPSTGRAVVRRAAWVTAAAAAALLIFLTASAWAEDASPSNPNIAANWTNTGGYWCVDLPQTTYTVTGIPSGKDVQQLAWVSPDNTVVMFYTNFSETLSTPEQSHTYPGATQRQMFPNNGKPTASDAAAYFMSGHWKITYTDASIYHVTTTTTEAVTTTTTEAVTTTSLEPGTQVVIIADTQDPFRSEWQATNRSIVIFGAACVALLAAIALAQVKK